MKAMKEYKIPYNKILVWSGDGLRGERKTFPVPR
jgi:hypothetical protein